MRRAARDKQTATDCGVWREWQRTRQSVLLTRRRLAALVGHLLADVGYLGAHLEHDPFDAAPDHKITTRRERELEHNDEH